MMLINELLQLYSFTVLTETGYCSVKFVT